MTNPNPILEQIVQQSTLDSIDISNSCFLRGCFDHTCYEWKESTLDEKVVALKNLISNDGENTLKLSMGMLSYCNEKAGKDIKLIDLVISMSYLLDHLLKEEK